MPGVAFSSEDFSIFQEVHPVPGLREGVYPTTVRPVGMSENLGGSSSALFVSQWAQVMSRLAAAALKVHQGLPQGGSLGRPVRAAVSLFLASRRLGCLWLPALVWDFPGLSLSIEDRVCRSLRQSVAATATWWTQPHVFLAERERRIPYWPSWDLDCGQRFLLGTGQCASWNAVEAQVTGGSGQTPMMRREADWEATSKRTRLVSDVLHCELG